MNDLRIGLQLGALEEVDAPTIQGWRQDPATRDGALGFPFPTSIESEKEWIRGFASRGTPQQACLAVRDESGRLLGYCQLRGIDWLARVAEFGIVIGTDARGRGVGAGALALTLQYAEQTLGLRRVWLRVAAFNSQAIGIYERAGFEPEGRLRAHAYCNGAFHDVLIYARFLSQTN